jgi:hypothetical protein
MAIQSITNILTEGLMSVLSKLIEDAQDQYEATDAPVWIAIEHWARKVHDEAGIRAVLNEAQDQFANHGREQAEWLTVFADLLRYGGDTISGINIL